jgi:predicted esterase
MRVIFTWIIATAILMLGAPIAWAENAEVDPAAINPLAADAGAFLDTDLAEWQTTAREAYDAQDYQKAAQYYLALLHYNAKDGNSIYNLACCYGLMGEAELAAKYLERAAKAGFEEFGMAAHDADFDSVRDADVFKETLAKLAAAQKARDAGAGTLMLLEAPTYHECYVQLPDNYDPAKTYTLVVGLHGYGASPKSFMGLWERFSEHDFIFASLEAPYAFSVGGDLGYSWITGLPDDEEFWKQTAVSSADYVAHAVEELRGRYSVDEVYLLGFSQGCTLTYLTGILHHEYFDGIVCFAGWLEMGILTDEDIAAANHLRVFIAHGNEDRVVEFSSSEKARDKLLENGYDVTFFEFAGPHSVPAEPLRAAEAWIKGAAG